MVRVATTSPFRIHSTRWPSAPATSASNRSPFTADAGVIADALGRLQPADQPARIDALLDLLRAALAESAGSEGETGRQPLRVLLVSASPWPANVPIPPGVDLQMVPVEEPRPLSNAGIVGLGARRDEQDLGTVRVFGRLRSPGTAARPVSVELRLAPAGTLADRPNLPDGAFLATPSGIQTVTLTPVPGAVPPALEGTVAFTLSGLSPAGGEVLKLALLEPDALMSDNAAMVLLPRAEPPRILMVAPGPDGRDADPLLLAILRDIADPSGLRPNAVRTTSAEGYTQWAGRSGLIALQPADLVVFDRVSAETPAPAPTLSFAAAPRESGLTFTPAGEGAPADNLRFVSWLRSHPVMRYAGLDAVFVRRPGRLNWTEQAGTVGGGTIRVTVLAESPLGAAIALAEPAGAQPTGGQARAGTSAGDTPGPKHVAVAFRPGDSNWPADVSFPVFMLSAVEYLTARATALEGRAATTVSPATLPLPVRTDPAGNPLTIDLFRLAETGEPVRIASATPPTLAGMRQEVSAAGTIAGAGGRAARATVSFGVLEKAGLYVARLPGDQTGAEPGDTLLPVNLVSESATELRMESNAGQRPAGMPTGGDAAPALVRPRELWPVLLLFAVLLLTVEWLVFAARMRSL